MNFFLAKVIKLTTFFRMAKREPKKSNYKTAAHAVSLRLQDPLYSEVAKAAATLQISVTSVLRLAVDRGLPRVMEGLAK